jgi:cytochrome c6
MIKKKYLYLIFFLILNFFNQHLKADEMFELGKNIFLNKAYCASCHTLADAGSVGNIGPNLNEIKPEYIRILNAVTIGIGTMQAYEGILNDKEIESVVHYVFESTNK